MLLALFAAGLGKFFLACVGGWLVVFYAIGASVLRFLDRLISPPRRSTGFIEEKDYHLYDPNHACLLLVKELRANEAAAKAAGQTWDWE